MLQAMRRCTHVHPYAFYMYVCIYYMHTYMNVYIHIHTLYICIHIYVHMHMFTPIYTEVWLVKWRLSVPSVRNFDSTSSRDVGTLGS